jgi:chemotaxis protein methyltransferase WspC
MTQMDFANLLKDAIGLDSNSVGISAIERAVRDRMVVAGIGLLEEYWTEVRTSKDELQELIETVVVPETWFFRDPEAFSVLVRFVREEWLPTHRADALRVLSVPCATGEEPYTIVMALLDGGIPRNSFRVDAVDISARSLARARLAQYGMNSFRGDNLAYRDRYFRPADRGYALAEWLPGLVNFRQGNLLTTALTNDSEPYDVVFCRNLTIYFDRATQERIMSILRSLLSPAGLLFVGGAETYLASRSGFASVNDAMSFAFRKKTQQHEFPVNFLPARETDLPLFRAALPQVSVPTHSGSCPIPVTAPPRPVDLETVQRLADAGKRREAVEQCEIYFRQCKPSPEAWYLLAVLKDSLGDWQNAAECYRKLLYLDPEHVDALTHLALLTEAHGDVGSARQMRERARRIESRRKVRL